MKYKICQLVDTNGDHWYQVKIKGLLFWYWAFNWGINWTGIFTNRYKEIIKFSSEQSAEEYIRNDILRNNKSKTKIIKCVEI